MPKYLIERELPGAGKLSPADLKAVSQKSCSVLRNLGPQIQWVQSYVTDDKIYCVYNLCNDHFILVYEYDYRLWSEAIWFDYKESATCWCSWWSNDGCWNGDDF